MGCAQSSKKQKYGINKAKINLPAKQQKASNITQEFLQKAIDQGISVENIVLRRQNDPLSSNLVTRDCRPKIQSHPTLLHNIEILHKHNFPKLKPLSCNSLFKNRQSLGLSITDQRSTIASLQPHKCSIYFTDNQQNDTPTELVKILKLSNRAQQQLPSIQIRN